MTELQYENLDADAKVQIETNISQQTPEPDYASFLGAWEAEHYSHSVLHQQVLASGNHPTEKCPHEIAMETLATSITNVRAGNKPDGSPLAPKPEPTPNADAPVAPAPAEDTTLVEQESTGEMDPVDEPVQVASEPEA